MCNSYILVDAFQYVSKQKSAEKAGQKANRTKHAHRGSFSEIDCGEAPGNEESVFNDGRLTYELLADAARLADEVVLLNCLLTCICTYIFFLNGDWAAV